MGQLLTIQLWKQQDTTYQSVWICPSEPISPASTSRTKPQQLPSVSKVQTLLQFQIKSTLNEWINFVGINMSLS